MEKFKLHLFTDCYVYYRNYTRCQYLAQKEEYRLQFSALYSLIEELELEEEYQDFKKFSPHAR